MNTQESNFQFFTPIHLEKGKDASGKKMMRLAGIASTSSKDADGEFLDPNGFELDYFMKYGYMNWNHQTNKDPLALIGKPTEAVKKSEGLHIGCELFENNPRAREVYKLAEMLEANGHQLGFSIEGKVIERDKKNPKIVKKAKITGCAITPNPKNRDTIAQIIKGENFQTISAYDDATEEEREKALATGSPSGQALSKESLDNSVKVTTYGDHNWNKDVKLTKAETMAFIFENHPEVELETTEKYFTLIETIQKSIQMEDNNSDVVVEISPEAIEKAMEILKISKEEIEKTPEKDEASTAEGSEAAAEDASTEDLEKGDMYNTISKMDFSKMKKGDMKKMYKMMGDQMKKMEESMGDDDDDGVEKGINNEAINAAQTILKAAGFSVSEEETSEGMVEKGENDDLNKDSSVVDLIKSEFAGMRDDTEAKIEAQTTLIKGFREEIAEMRGEMEEMKNFSPGPKTVTSTVVEKSWNEDLEKGLSTEESGEKTLSISLQKGIVMDEMEKGCWSDDAGITDKKLANALQRFEASNEVTSEMQTYFKKQGVKLVK